MTSCPHCGCTEIYRVRRRGITDKIRTVLNRWPYYCDDCNQRFYAVGRYRHHQAETPRPNQPHQETQSSPGQQEGPELVFRKSEVRPAAQVVISADSHEQLDQILLALGRAVNSYQHVTRAKEHTASASR